MRLRVRPDPRARLRSRSVRGSGMTPIAAISQQIWDMKYRLKGPNGAALDKTIEDTWRRIASALAAPEADLPGWADRFYGALENFRFLPAGRIVAGAGSGRQVTLFNC